MIYPALGKYEKAVEEGKKQIEIDPDFAFAYVNSAFSHHICWTALRKPRTSFSEPPSANWKSPTFWSSDTTSPFLKGDKAGMEREVALAQGTSGAEDLISDQAAFVLAYSGHLQQARTNVTATRWTWLSRRPSGKGRLCSKPDRHCGKPFSGMRRKRGKARWRHCELSKDRDVEYGAAFALRSRGGFSAVANARERSGKALSGGYGSQVQLPAGDFAHFSR